MKRCFYDDIKAAAQKRFLPQDEPATAPSAPLEEFPAGEQDF